MKTKVSVVIPNYNGQEYLEKCVDSLMAQTVRSFEIIIVDDASSDDSFLNIQKKYPANGAYPRTRYISHERNLGFCKSVNDGIKAAESDYIFLLNNDTEVMPECIRQLYHTICSDDRIFSVGAKMVSLQNPDIMDNAGDYYCSLGWAYTPAKDKQEQRFQKKKKIFSACGGGVMYRKSMLEKLGSFDENHFAYLEDVDLGYRATLYGYVNLFEPKAIVRHAGSASSGSRYNAFKARLTARNNVYLIYKNMPNWQILLNLPVLNAGMIIKILFYIKKGLGKTYVSGILEGFQLCRSIRGQQRRLDFKKLGSLPFVKMQFVLMWNTIRRFLLF